MGKSISNPSKKIALVTGAANGIGRETALAFSLNNYDVAISDMDKSHLEETKELIKRQGKGSAHLMVVDISDQKAVKSMIEEIIKHFGRLDAACNNAGVEGASAPTAEYSIEQWDRVLNVNLRGQFLCMKYEIESMLKSGGGSIVNVSSILGMVGYAQASAYTAAKHGLLGLTKAAAIEYAPQHVRINAVCPGFIKTPMLERAGITTDKGIMEQITALHPMGRLGNAREVADAIVWLAGEQASFITGEALLVDGGYTAR